MSSRNAIGIPITFTSPGRGVFLASLVFDSNAENIPTYELEVVGPGAAYDYDISPIEPDIEFFEDPVMVEPTAAFAQPAAFARFYNLGGRTLTVTDYELSDATNFKFLDGTAEPGARCVYGAICNPDAPPSPECCNGGLTCRCRDFEADGVTCSEIIAQERGTTAPPCPNGQPECDPYGLYCDTDLAQPECVDICMIDSDCPTGELCDDGACGPPAQTCSGVNVTSGQFTIIGVELTSSAPSGNHQTTLEVTSNDGCTVAGSQCTPAVTSVTIEGNK